MFSSSIRTSSSYVTWIGKPKRTIKVGRPKQTLKVGALRSCKGLLEGLGRLLGGSGGALGRLLGALGSSKGLLEALGRLLGGSWRPLGRLLGGSWVV